jgi:triosephosphate isomerase
MSSSVRRPYLAGNWKMNLERQSALELVRSLAAHVEDRTDREVAVVPPFVYLDEVARALAGSPIRVGAQNMCDEESGAFTGEVSARMLVDVGCDFVVLGHSERRHVYGETDELVNRKVHRALASDLSVILCVGELLEERQAGATEQVVSAQTGGGLAGVSATDMERVTIAYEPVWAIGTGQVATPDQAGQVHEYLRGVVAGLYDQRTADAVRIQYGGSVKPDNVAELMAVPGVDGALVGGASLKADSFQRIIDFDA